MECGISEHHKGVYNLCNSLFDFTCSHYRMFRDCMRRIVIYRKDLKFLRENSESFRVSQLGGLFCECVVQQEDLNLLNNYRIWYEITGF